MIPRILFGLHFSEPLGVFSGCLCRQGDVYHLDVVLMKKVPKELSRVFRPNIWCLSSSVVNSLGTPLFEARFQIPLSTQLIHVLIFACGCSSGDVSTGSISLVGAAPRTSGVRLCSLCQHALQPSGHSFVSRMIPPLLVTVRSSGKRKVALRGADLTSVKRTS